MALSPPSTITHTVFAGVPVASVDDVLFTQVIQSFTVSMFIISAYKASMLFCPRLTVERLRLILNSESVSCSSPRVVGATAFVTETTPGTTVTIVLIVPIAG